jgi:acylphosphatase
MVHYSLTIIGSVQGVSFRQSAKTKAQELHLTGFVKNLANGNVYIEVEGVETDVYSFIDWCHYGPRRAKVLGVEIEVSELKNFENFQIKY